MISAAAAAEAASETAENFALLVNGQTRPAENAHSLTLLAFLRERLGLTGTKEACGRGECGACTVLIDGVPQLACIKPVALVAGAVTTIEGLAEEWRDLRAAFAEHGGFQCGFCTSGQIVHLAAILNAGLPRDAAAAERHLRHRLSGNICRCTGYAGIVAAALSVARKRGLVDGGV
ncbi:MAG: 2Fe-2S iron-sulfur cluster binding domain-containing protein [Rhodospirillaceae bacterium]|nr:2Fe-2S iron-sulfur cluster binding domain-containing protein [Rhodospirillaceae bacterium]